jgi:hypothetical protein
MNDLDTDLLRRALRAPQEPGPLSAGRAGPDDITEIITRGRRLRWRRRAMAAGGSVCLAAAVVGTVAGIGRLTAPSSGPAQHVVSPVGGTRTRLAPAPSPDPGRATPSPVASATAAPTVRPTATDIPAASATPSQIPPSQPLPTPTSTGAAVSASSAAPPTSSPSASAAPSATPSATPSAASAGTAVQHADRSAPGRPRS